jgi:hypothetical protein
MNALSRIVFAVATASCGFSIQHQAAGAPLKPIVKTMISSQYINATDGTQLYVKDWGPKSGPVVVFSAAVGRSIRTAGNRKCSSSRRTAIESSLMTAEGMVARASHGRATTWTSTPTIWMSSCAHSM